MADDFEVAALLKAFHCRSVKKKIWAKEKRRGGVVGGGGSMGTCVLPRINKGNGKPKKNLFAAKVFCSQIKRKRSFT